MKAIILARVSTEEQREAGNSLPAQIKRLEAYCERKGLTVVETFSFDESAFKNQRNEFDKVLAYLKTTKETVALCFDKVDRFSRNIFDKRVAELYELAVAGKIELHFVSDHQVINGELSATEKSGFSMNLVMASYYSNAISDNVRRAFEQKRRNGEWTSPAPFGYLNAPLDEGKRLRKDIIPDPERAHLVRQIFELYSTGNHSISSLWHRMDTLGLRGRSGKKLARSKIESTLKDPFYYGMARSQKYGLYQHRYEPLITRDLFDKCQAVIAGRRKKPSKQVANTYIFRGLLTCKRCGCLLSPETKKGRYTYYSCTNAKGTCQRVYIREETLLKPVQDVFEQFRAIPVEVQERLVSELRKTSGHQTDFHEAQIKRIRAEYDRVQGRIDTLLDMRLDQSITQDDHDKKLQQLKDQQARLNIELEEHTNADHQFHLHVSHVLNLSRRMGEVFESSEPAEKRAILNFLLQNPTVSGKTLEFTLRKPFETVLELSRHPNWLRGQDSNLQPPRYM